MNCNQCEQNYDLHKRTPKILSKCGHTICSSCLSKLSSTVLGEFKCPFDNIYYQITDNFLTNDNIIQYLEKNTLSNDKCLNHAKRKDVYCFECKVDLCSECALFDGHRLHQVEQIDSIRTNEQRKYLKLVESFETLKFQIKEKYDLAIKDSQSLRVSQQDLIEKFFDVFYRSIEGIKRNSLALVNRRIEDGLETYRSLQEKLKSVQEEIINYEKSGKRVGEISEIETRVEKYLFKIQKFLSDKNNIFESKELEFSKFTPNQNWEQMLQNIFVNNNVINIASNSQFKATTSLESILRQDDNLLQESIRNIASQKSPIRETQKTEPRSFIPNSPNAHTQRKKNISNSPNSAISSNSNNMKTLYSVNKPVPERQKVNASSRVVANENASVKSTLSNNTTSIYHNKENMNDNISTKTYPIFDSGSNDSLLKILNSVEKNKDNVLDLSGMNITDDKIGMLIKGISKLSSLKTINLSDNHLTDSGVKIVLKGLMGLTLEYIFMNNNKLGDSALDFFISFGKYNNSLKGIYLSNNQMSSSNTRIKSKAKLLQDKNVTVIL